MKQTGKSWNDLEQSGAASNKLKEAGTNWDGVEQVRQNATSWNSLDKARID